jgi:hypothetical protein
VAAITAAEVIWRYSVKTGAAGNSTASSAAASLGTWISTTAWAGGAANDLFDDITGAENAASTVDYRCVFIYNSNGANALQNAVVTAADVAGGANVTVAADSTAASTLASGTAQALTATTETAPGAGVTGLTYGATATLGNIPAGFVKALWVRRTATNSSALSSDGVTLSVTGDTGSL